MKSNISFMDLVEKELNVSTTENGALGYKSTGSALVDFNFKLASYRNPRNYGDIIKDFAKVWGENNELALKYLFYMRDVREGVGERETFRQCIKELANVNVLDSRVFDWIEEYGRLDDIFVFFDTKLEDKMIQWVNQKLFDDTINATNNKPISLLAKWMPSINTSSRKTRDLANRFCKALNIQSKDYRKTLSKLRTYLDVLEKKLCKNEWDKVNYESVPSNANLKYNKAFYKHDKERRESYLESLKKGEAKINSKVLFPHDIVNKYVGRSYWDTKVNKYDEALEQIWKGLPNYIQDKSNILVVRDGSGSMTSTVGNTTIQALDVSTALAIYFSEKLSGPYKDKFITFSSRPEFVDLSKLSTLHDKLVECYSYDDCSNTNIEATFDLILKVAKQNNLSQEEIPTVLIISDMEFDHATYYTSKNTLFKDIAKKFNNAGYDLPRCVFWNVNSRTNTIPLTQNKMGVTLVSGFSPAITKLVLNGELDPYKALVKEITSDRYKQITL